METFEISSDLPCSPAVAWAHVSSLEGINAELSPIRMTFPPELALLKVKDVKLGVVLLHSWVLLAGFLPLDRHALCLTELVDGEGFREESTSWLQRRWIHDRRITPLATGCRVTDRLSFEPRLGLLRPIISRVVRTTFERRHRHLQEILTPAGAQR